MSPIHHRKHHANSAGPAAARVGSDPRTARILAKAIYKEARGAGMEEKEVVAVATELLGLVAEDMKAARQ